LDAHRPTSCTEVNRDRYKRIIAVCSAGGRDVAEWLVSNGHALDWPRYSKDAYAGAQNNARAARRGIWAGSFALPWEWRRNRDAALIDANSES
jgi:endonuclease YncB( thermonuclease family)